MTGPGDNETPSIPYPEDDPERPKLPSYGWIIGQKVAVAMGYSGPVGLGIAALGWFLGRRVKKRISERGDGGQGEGPPEHPFHSQSP